MNYKDLSILLLNMLCKYELKYEVIKQRINAKFQTLSNIFKMCCDTIGISFYLNATSRPEIIWQTDSLKTILETAYALAITDKASPLKMCKQCRKAYYNANARSEFCSVKCRNHYNVIAFRQRGKE